MKDANNTTCPINSTATANEAAATYDAALAETEKVIALAEIFAAGGEVSDADIHMYFECLDEDETADEDRRYQFYTSCIGRNSQSACNFRITAMRLAKLIKMGAADIIIANEKRNLTFFALAMYFAEKAKECEGEF